MKKFLYVLKFELNNYFQSKGYMAGTIITAVVIFIILSLPSFINIPFLNEITGQTESVSSEPSEDTENESLEKWLLLDKAGILEESQITEMLGSLADITVLTDEQELKDGVESDQADAGFILYSYTDYSYLVRNTSFSDNRQSQFEAVLSTAFRQQELNSAGLDYAYVEEVYNTPITSNTEILGKDSTGSYFYAYALIMILYFIIILYGQMIATSVTQEKSNRAIEILVTSTSSNILIFGKVIASTLASVIQVGMLLGSGVIGYKINQSAWGGMLDMVLDIPAEVLLAFLFFGFGGYLFYAFLFGAFGALVSKTEDIGKSTGSIMMFIIIAFFIAIFSLTNPDSILIKVTSFVPFTSGFTMIVRVTMGTVSAFEVIISFLILLVSIILAGILGAKIFRMGTLRYGNPIKLSNAIKGIRNKE